MTLIRDILERDLNQKIAEIIKVNQADEETVFEEITEYVVTDNIRKQYQAVLEAISKGPQTHQTDENIGIWVSGFFGSGKSSFAKILGYILKNPSIHGSSASALFKDQIKDTRVSEYLDYINAGIPTEVIMFDISTDRLVKHGGLEPMAEIMYRKLLEHLGYSTDFDIAELEIQLEEEGTMDTFLSAFASQYPDTTWEKARIGATKLNRASATLHQMEPQTFPTATSWAESVKIRQAELTVNKIVGRIFDLPGRRIPGKALVFVIDEVGQYVARSSEKIEDLRALVEQIGKEGKSRLKERKIPAPIWLVVTSQEKLNEVIAAIDSKNVQIARLQDRFAYKVDLSPADIREVASRRVLSKKEAAVPALQQMFQQSEGRLIAQCSLERSGIATTISADTFVESYPYLPYMIDLSIRLMSAIRLQSGAVKHQGGANRTIIKQAYEMLVSERTRLADAPVGRLVTLDLIYELVEANLSVEGRMDMMTILSSFEEEGDSEWPVRVAKVIMLLTFVREIPRTPKNIASVLISEVGQDAPVAEVKAAVDRLLAKRFIKETEEGYKLLSQGEKTWDEERQALKGEIRPADRTGIMRDQIGKSLTDPKLKTYRHQNLKNFKVSYSVDGTRVSDPGSIVMYIEIAEDPEKFPVEIERVQSESRGKDRQYDIFWVMSATPKIDEMVTELFASREMVRKYDQARAQNKINAIEQECLEAEKKEQARWQARLSEKLFQSLSEGVGIFQGVRKESAALGKDLSSAFLALFGYAAPILFPHLSVGAVNLKGNEAERVLRDENLSGLPAIFYDGNGGLSLVRKENNNYVINPEAPIVALVLEPIRRQHEYGGEAISGKYLEQYFGGYGFGWDSAVVMMTLATLFRGGMLAVMHQSKTYESYDEKEAQAIFTTIPKFRSSAFILSDTNIPVEALVRLSDLHREMTGVELDIDEVKIAAGFVELANKEYDGVVGLAATIRSYKLPHLEDVENLKVMLQAIRSAPSSRAVCKVLQGYDQTLRHTRDQYLGLSRRLTDSFITVLESARRFVPIAAPAVEDRIGGPELKALTALLASDDLIEREPELQTLLSAAEKGYGVRYREAHADRNVVFTGIRELLHDNPDFERLTPAQQEIVQGIVEPYICTGTGLSDQYVCPVCKANVATLSTHTLLRERLTEAMNLKIQEFLIPPERIKQVKISTYLPSRIEDAEDLDLAVAELKAELQKLLDEGYTLVFTA
ncbi:BREX system P-loop protein BrxC [uncultured Methanospirillum sp.]|uniref:BREX system P-loop protein BrxC n=1 Tax=uncultured Methanospirillum sp. TaxID=262503 RepID=UPI0029C6B79A|nr:BREX system P-loop protein BrxC [uncultured Methanospirillum sp.]